MGSNPIFGTRPATRSTWGRGNLAIRLATLGLLVALTFGGCGLGQPAGSTVGCATDLIDGQLTAAGSGLSIGGLPVRWWNGWTVRTEAGRLVVADEMGRTRAGAGDTVRLGGGHIGDAWIACPDVFVYGDSTPAGSAG
jgi:hypothetical protein